MKSTRYYNQHAAALCDQYNAIDTDEVHGSDEQENIERGFHEVPADDVLEYAKRRAVALTERFSQPNQTHTHLHPFPGVTANCAVNNLRTRRTPLITSA